MRTESAERQQPDKVKKKYQQAFAPFFDAYDPTTAKQYLTHCIETCLSTDNEHFDTALSRANLIYFYHLLEEVLDHAYLLSKQETSNPAKNRNLNRKVKTQ